MTATTRNDTPKTTPWRPNASGLQGRRRPSPPSRPPSRPALRLRRRRRCSSATHTTPTPTTARQDQQPVPDSRPGRVLRDHGCHLREREDEDEIEEELQRRDPVLDLDRLLAHQPRLPRTELRRSRRGR